MAGRPRRHQRGGILKPDARIDYKNIELLERFVDEGGRMQSRRKLRTTAKQQRRITRAVKRARHLALLPISAQRRSTTG